MKSSETLRMSPMDAQNYAAADAPLGRDAGRDNAHYCAAVTIFAVVGIAIVGVAGLWLTLRERPAAQAFNVFEDINAAVSADMPVLRPGFAGDDVDAGVGSFTFLDGSTGQREIVEMAPPVRSASSASENPVVAR
ncbi:hypothetical protein ACO2RV_15700 [Ancylobacter sp. VNQ12]|uniref:hypothetical protein n=1 Tax=Ancylobacter sp. VNQ12 TaxID=3400920 RepID=UPI003BFE9C11